jgi:hypothetical protein
MNCATHGDQAAVAFCRTCGKPLCQSCTRDVRGVIYCESCLAARLEGTPAGTSAPTPGYTPVQTVYSPGTPPFTPGLPPTSSGPNPAVAGILAGFFPIGVGAVYNSQYAKGLAHLVIMVLLIIGVSSSVPWYVSMVLGIGIGFFYFYQIIDAVRTAKAIQTGQPAPDPFGLAQVFGTGEKVETTTKVPVGAAILIGAGVLFLLHTAGFFEFGLERYWPLILIFLGVWLFAKQWGLVGGGRSSACQCERCRTRKIMWPAILVTLGILFLLDNTSRVGIDKTWPAILLVVGVVKLMQSNASSAGHVGHLPPGVPPNVVSGNVPASSPASSAPPANFASPNPSGAPDTSGPEQTSSSGEVKNV